MADGAQGPVPSPADVEGVDRLGGVLDDKKPVAVRDIHDRVHVTGAARVVDDGNDPGARRNERFDLRGVDVRLVFARVGEDDGRALADKRQRRRDKGVRGDDHLVAGSNARQDRRHLERVRARGRQQALAEAVTPFEKRLTALGELAVARDLSALDSLTDVLRLLSRHMRPVEVDHFRVRSILILPDDVRGNGSRRRTTSLMRL